MVRPSILMTAFGQIDITTIPRKNENDHKIMVTIVNHLHQFDS